MKQIEDLEVYTVEDLCEILHIGKSKAYKLVNTPGFPAFKMGKSIRIYKVYLVSWLQEIGNINNDVFKSKISM